ncbi:DNA integrity scanning diadenylate cyclase DisA [Ornithinimicrobium pratense]|uniref:DNA integrity scanning protein DisA n=1 Tax=Ornithinimicrobium pratense TaxID=2593973 RepID=A0A5J6V1W8_9MICO|nr:DNA integrity scanning diadenylate cyclase DisA [Ornithinimicrobium pratense]QFG67637.1 DNA integrity scanning protein DisA [Ornithinimicrobium pratense]
MAQRLDDEILQTLAAVAPGTELRDGLERVLRGRTGALIVLEADRSVETLCSGGFQLDVEFSAPRLRELAKMDGAILISKDGRFVRAGTQLTPDRSLETQESGTRHRTAERTAKQTGAPVICVSQSMSTISLYVGHARHILEDRIQVMAQANQALQTLERYRTRLDEVNASLSALEIEDLVTVRDLATALQRLEMVRRISAEIEQYVIQLGVDGRLIGLQLDELTGGVTRERELLIRDYVADDDGPRAPDQVLEGLASLDATELIDLAAVARALGIHVIGDGMDHQQLSPLGFRLLHRIPRLPGAIVDRLVAHFGSFQALLSASLDDLMQVEGVGETRARAVREGLSRLAENSILERYS